MRDRFAAHSTLVLFVLFVILLLLFLLFSALARPQLTILHCGKLIDGHSKNTKKVVSIIVEKNTIVDIADGYVDPGEGDLAIDLNGYTVLPGLMDMHVHLSGESKPKR